MPFKLNLYNKQQISFICFIFGPQISFMKRNCSCTSRLVPFPSFCFCVVELRWYATHSSVNFFQEERLQHANLRPSGLRPLFLYTLLVFRWLLQCPIRTSSTVTATSQALTNLLRSYRTATRHHSSLPIRYT